MANIKWQILQVIYQFQHQFQPALYHLLNFPKPSSILDFQIRNSKNTIQKSNSRFGKENPK